MSAEYPLLEPIQVTPSPSAPPPDSVVSSFHEEPQVMGLHRMQTIFPEYHGESKEDNVRGFGRRVQAAGILFILTAVSLPIGTHYGYKNWYGLAASLVLGILQILIGLMGIVAFRRESTAWTNRFKLSLSVYLLLMLLPFLVAYEIAGLYLTITHNNDNCSEFTHYTVCDQRWGIMYPQLLNFVYLSALDLFLLMLLVSVRRACNKFIHVLESPHINYVGIS